MGSGYWPVCHEAFDLLIPWQQYQNFQISCMSSWKFLTVINNVQRRKLLNFHFKLEKVCSQDRDLGINDLVQPFNTNLIWDDGNLLPDGQ